MTDFRALCAELTEFVARLTKHYYQPAELLTRARAALANEPAVSNPPGPTDQDLLRLYKVATPCYKVEEYKRELDFARAVLARWGTPNSAETRRSLGEPAAGEVAELVAWLRGANWDRQRQTPATRAADLLERLSPPQPVPVSERLPGPEDCDAEGRCWVYVLLEAWAGEPEFFIWELKRAKYASANYGASHWLPAHALPLPEVGND